VYLCPIGDRGHCRNAGEEHPLLSHTVETAVRRMLRRSCASGRLTRTTFEGDAQLWNRVRSSVVGGRTLRAICCGKGGFAPGRCGAFDGHRL
jgi:hypothetical protein